MAKPARIALMGGMGYPATETAWGMPALKARLEALPAVTVLLVGWSERQAVFNFMHNFDGFRAYAGDSLGAGSAGQYPADVGGADFAAGFQPSLYDARSHDGVQTIASAIKRAHCVYDPYWIDTFGLGRAFWETAPGSGTKLLITQHRGAHPDDWGYSQDLIFNELKGLIDAS